MKVYELKFTVRHGEYCFNFMNLLEAKDDEDAQHLAHLYCCDFYGEGEKEDENIYTFHAGCLALTINSVEEVTDKEAWKEDQYK